MVYFTFVIPLSELRDLPFFAALDERTLADIARQMQICDYRPGEYILLEGEQPSGLFFVRRGRVRLSRTVRIDPKPTLRRNDSSNR